MKTRVSKISNLILSLSICLFLQSCNKEDFFEKDYLSDAAATEDPGPGNAQGGSNNNSNNNGQTDGDTNGSSSGGQSTGGSDGSVSSGSNGGADGSATSGSTNGGVDGSTTSGGTTGSGTGGTDGSTTSGQTTGGTTGSSTTGGTTGSSTTGGTTGSSTTGGTTGSSTTGGTTGSSTTGGTTGSTTGGTTGSSTGGTTGGSTGDTTGGSTFEVFKQSSSLTKKLDIVWIIDNSGSMADEQTDLGTNFSAFIDEFILKDVDFKMAITTTDTSSASLKGKMVTGSDTKLTSAKAKLSESQFKQDFRNLVKVGTSGSGFEKGLEASEGFMQKYAATFLRSDAYLAVVVLSDEEDQSANAVKYYTDNLKSFKKEAGLVKVYTIADLDRTNSGNGITTGADRYIKASNETAGVIANIRDDFHMSLSAMGDSIINLLDSFALAKDPVASSLRVYVNNVETNDYTFDAASRSIKFNPNRLPPVGAEIKVYYTQK
jgi:hypothetical protein